MKTEKPTPRRLQKEARKGKSFNSRDLTAAAVLVAGTMALLWATSLRSIMQLYQSLMGRIEQLSATEATLLAFKAFAYAAAPVLVVSIVAVVLVSLSMSKGILAVEAIRLDFNKLNPISGFKNLFTVRAIKDLVRALLYTLLGGLFVAMAWPLWSPLLFSQVQTSPAGLIAVWLKLGTVFTLGLLAILAPLYLLVGWLDHHLHLRDLKMEKHEVKQEHKDDQGNPEIKQRRRDLGAELSAQVQADVLGSNVILANPTHIAVGIFMLDADSQMPFVAVRESGRRARAVIALAEAAGIPVVRDRPVARAVYHSTKRYHFLATPQIAPVLRILQWLRDVELAAHQDGDAPDGTEADGQTPTTTPSHNP